MQAYVFYTDNILDCIEVLQKSVDEIDDLEIVLVKGRSEHTSDLAGATHDPQYMKLMLTRWQKIPDIIRSNIDSNILFNNFVNEFSLNCFFCLLIKKNPVLLCSNHLLIALFIIGLTGIVLTPYKSLVLYAPKLKNLFLFPTRTK